MGDPRPELKSFRPAQRLGLGLPRLLTIDPPYDRRKPVCYNLLPMPLTLEEVRHIALLARLRLTPDEERRFAEQLSAVLAYADRLRHVDVTGIPPTATVLGVQAPLRPDTIRASLPRDLLLANAPATEDGMFRVPAVLGPS